MGSYNASNTFCSLAHPGCGEETRERVRVASVDQHNLHGGASGVAAATSSDGSPGTAALKIQKIQAKLPTDSRMAIRTSTSSSGFARAASNPPAKMLNLLKKPLNGGTPVTASAATAKLMPTSGILPHNPAQVRQHARAGGEAQRPGHQEEQALGKGMVEDMRHRTVEGQG